MAEADYDNTNTITSNTLYVWDGWWLVSELDGLENKRVLAEYVPGPAYVDDTVAFRRDHNRDGDFADAGEGFLYCLADQQHSTVALLDANGDVVERYGYDAFGAPTFHDGEGVEQVGVDESAYGNTRLYTGREWLPALSHYDYRQRVYDPANGRFLTTDPIGAYGDPNNLGNPYTYVANNPYSFVDPYGEERWGAQSYFADVADVGYGYFIAGPVGAVTGTASALWHYDKTIQGIRSLAVGLTSDPLGTASGLASGFAAQFEDSDTAGQATFGAASSVVGGFASAAKIAGRVGMARSVATAGDDAAKAAAKAAHRAEMADRVRGNVDQSSATSRKSKFAQHILNEKAVIRAREIHEVLTPIAQRMTNTAVATTQERKLVVGYSANLLRPIQRQTLLPGEIDAVGPAHAEITAVYNAKQMGLHPVGVAASRPICPECVQTLQEYGVRTLTAME